MPVGPYKDMAACMAANQDKADPKAFCAAMEHRMKLAKLDQERQLVFGWANVAVRKNGEVVTDHQGDQIDPTVLENAAYGFTLESGEGDEMHTATVRSHLVESFMVTPDKLEAMGLAKNALPLGWWVGFHVEDPQTWERVKAGELSMFSIAGVAEAVPA